MMLYLLFFERSVLLDYAWKVFVFGAILVRIQSEYGKIRTRITPYMGTFYAVGSIALKESKNDSEWKFRTSHRRCSVKRAVLKTFAIFIGKHLCWSLLIKLHIWKSAVFLKKTVARVFSCEFCEIFKNTFFTLFCLWNIWFSNVFRGYRNGTLIWNGLIVFIKKLLGNTGRSKEKIKWFNSIVIKTEEMHQKLVQVNEHQQCIISTHHKDLLKCQQELLDTKSSLKLQEQKLKQKEDLNSVERDNNQHEVAIKGVVSDQKL